MSAEQAFGSEHETVFQSVRSHPGSGGSLRARPLLESSRRIKPYDFRHPEKLSKEQLRGLQIIQQGVATSMAQAFSSRLRAPVEARLTSLERSIYDEYTARVGQDAIIVIIDMAPLQGYAVAAFGLDVAFGILDRLLGGRGRARASAPQRDLTDIEVALIRHIGMDISNSLVEPWTRVAELTPEITELAVGPQVVHVVPPSEFVIAAWYELHLADLTGDISLCFPLTILEQIIPQLTGQNIFESRSRASGKPDFKVREDQVHPVSVGLRAMLGSATVTASDIGALVPGDVLVLETTVTDPVRVVVGNIERYAASPGTRGKRLALQLSGLVDGDGVVVPFPTEDR